MGYVWKQGVICFAVDEISVFLTHYNDQNGKNTSL